MSTSVPHPRFYHLQRGDEPAVGVACCACGEVGPPAALGWTGDRCAPCHDRGVDGLPVVRDEYPLQLAHEGPIHALAFNPTGDRLAVSSRGRTITLHDLRTPRKPDAIASSPNPPPGNVIRLPRREFRPMVFSPDGQTLVAADVLQSRLRAWDLAQAGTPQTALPLGPSQWIAGLAFSPNGDALACCSDAGDLRIWQTVGWRDTYLSRGITALDFAPDSRTLALGEANGGIRLLDVGTWAQRERLAVAEDYVHFVKYSPDGQRLIVITGNPEYHTGRSACRLRTWTLSPLQQLHEAAIPMISSVETSPDGRFLAWLVHDEEHSPAAVHFWDLHSWRFAGSVEWDTSDDLHELTFAPDGRTLATGSMAGMVKFWPWAALLA